ncbi:DUF6000 family protein [Nocardia asteroides]|uniref:DUF6000 family protein n=1 Tax=Nocardia asteroides TaxID=1824 RepID=UPI0034336FC5
MQRWVIGDVVRPGRYTTLRGLNLLRDRPYREQLEAGLAADARQITDAELSLLLELNWRPRLTAAWLIALDRRTEFRDELAELLRCMRYSPSTRGLRHRSSRVSGMGDCRVPQSI